MFCSKCGFQINTGDNFCSKCGAKVVQTTISDELKFPFESGDIVKFGIIKQDDDRPTPIEWIVLDRVDNSYLLFSKNIINSMTYSNGLKWLNDDDSFLCPVFPTCTERDIFNCKKVEGYQFLGDVEYNPNTDEGGRYLFAYLSAEMLKKYKNILANIECKTTKNASEKYLIKRAWLNDVNEEYAKTVENNYEGNECHKDNLEGIRPAMWVRFY